MYPARTKRFSDQTKQIQCDQVLIRDYILAIRHKRPVKHASDDIGNLLRPVNRAASGSVVIDQWAPSIKVTRSRSEQNPGVLWVDFLFDQILSLSHKSDLLAIYGPNSPLCFHWLGCHRQSPSGPASQIFAAEAAWATEYKATRQIGGSRRVRIAHLVNRQRTQSCQTDVYQIRNYRAKPKVGRPLKPTLLSFPRSQKNFICNTSSKKSIQSKMTCSTDRQTMYH